MGELVVPQPLGAGRQPDGQGSWHQAGGKLWFCTCGWRDQERQRELRVPSLAVAHGKGPPGGSLGLAVRGF